jgi:L-asparaginase
MPIHRVSPRCILAIALLLLAPRSSAARAPAPPRVRLVATGGTISNRIGGRLTADVLVKSIPGLERYARAETEQFSNVASSELSLDRWLALARRLNEVFRGDPELAGIVVTGGTDTLEELAYFLDLTVRDERPVVVVGSMRNPSTIGYEGAANLLEGFRVAASPDARGQGVLVVLNDEINAARDVSKTDALRLQTFQSRPYGVLGVVDSDRVVFFRRVIKRHTAKSEFDVRRIEALPRVDVFLAYQDAPGDLLEAAARLGARGVVVAGAGAGATSASQGNALRALADEGVVVVMCTRTGSGRVAFRPPGDGPAAPRAATPPAAAGAHPAPRGRRGWIAGEDLAPVKARILLMLALAVTDDPAEIQRMFTEY